MTAGEVADELERRFQGSIQIPGGSKSDREAQGASKTGEGSLAPKPARDAVEAREGINDGKTSSVANSIQPGHVVRTDPLLKGFSGADKKWFARYLAQGLNPEEARDKTKSRKQQDVEPSKSQDQGKRKSSQITPPQSREHKKPRTGAMATAGPSTANAGAEELGRRSYASVATELGVAVLPKGFPQVTLSADELSTLEDAIIEEVSLGWRHKLKFSGLHYRAGFLLVDCADQETAGWLKEKTSRLQIWKGPELMACVGDSIPKTHNITVFLPKSSQQEDKKSLALIQAQNEGLAVKAWKVLKSKAEGKGQLMVISIDDVSAEAIRKARHELHYRFGKIGVNGLKKPAASNSLKKPEISKPQAYDSIKGKMPEVPPPKEGKQPNSGSQVDSLAPMDLEVVLKDVEMEGVDLALSQGPEVLPSIEEEEDLLADEGACDPIC